MSDVAIRVEGLGKQYRLGTQQERYYTLADQIKKWTSVRRLIRRSQLKEKRPMFWALKDVSFEVNRGEVVGIIGRNGAGKSTLLKILSRITEPTEGGADIYGRVGSLLEVGTGFHPELTGRENVFLNGAILGMRRAEIIRKFDEIVGFAEVEKFIDTPVKHYSSGMYTRLAFAVAAHLEPEILVVDEVLAVGDAQFQKKCLGKMGEVAKGGRTVLFVSHNMAAVQALCTKAIRLQSGKLMGYGDCYHQIQLYQSEAQEKPKTLNTRYLGPHLELLRFDCTPDRITSGDGFVFTMIVRAKTNLTIEHPHVLIYSSLDTRIAIIDLRNPEGDYRLASGQTLVLTAQVDCYNLVEGEYRIGIHLAYGPVRQNFLDLCTLEVSPYQNKSGLIPYEVMWRGQVELYPKVTAELI
jgi:lipopolysaccharide transport system ATP-binding protein